jgi:Tol biopolymer transport system component
LKSTALGDDAKNPKFIETQPRRGYRFIAQITQPETQQPAKSPAPRSHRWLAWAAGAGIFFLAALSGFIFRSREPAPAQPLFRFEIPPPENVTLAFVRFAVSPNGKHLVFWGWAKDTSVRLWLRDLDSLETRVLQSTETNDARIQPAWSPDSRSIAFNADGKIKRIDIAGGTAQVVCDVPGGLPVGLAWTRDDQIVFGTGSQGVGIMRVPANGGTPVRLTQLDRSRNDWVHAYPSLLPDGKHFLYARASRIPAYSGVYVGSLDASPSQQGFRHLPGLPALDSSSVYVAAPSGQGYILYRRQGTIMARRFDPKRLEFSGDWIAVADMAGTNEAQPGFSVSTNGVLVYQSEALLKAQPTWFDRNGKALGTIGEPDAYRSLRLAPDGRRVVATKGQDLWLIDPEHATTTRLTFGAPGEDVSHAVWSPDGTKIAFGATFGHRDYLDTYEKTLTGSGTIMPLVKARSWTRPTDWSRDGGYLLYDSLNSDTHGELWLLPGMETAPADHKPFVILHTGFDLGGAVFSPDMRWIAYTSDEFGKREVYVRPFAARTSATSPPGGGRLISNNGGVDVLWPRDSKELFYLTPDGKIMAVSASTSPELKVGLPQTVLDQHVARSLWDVTSDGKRLLAAVRDQRSQAPFTVTVLSNWDAALKH